LADLRRFILRRTLTFIPTLIGVTFITYIIAFIIPSDPARFWAGGIKAKPEVIARVTAEYHLNSPWYDQYYFLFLHERRTDQ
jgi:peptide/nickel transport system permease protein